eukprot:jgi/Picre1/33515/NNA_008839.t1
MLPDLNFNELRYGAKCAPGLGKVKEEENWNKRGIQLWTDFYQSCLRLDPECQPAMIEYDQELKSIGADDEDPAVVSSEDAEKALQSSDECSVCTEDLEDSDASDERRPTQTKLIHLLMSASGAPRVRISKVFSWQCWVRKKETILVRQGKTWVRKMRHPALCFS